MQKTRRRREGGQPRNVTPDPKHRNCHTRPQQVKVTGAGGGGVGDSQSHKTVLIDHKFKKKKKKKVHSNIKKRPGHSGHENSADSTRPCPQSGHSNNKVPGQHGVHHTRPTARGDCPPPPPPIQLPTDLPAIRAGHSGTPSARRCVGVFTCGLHSLSGRGRVSHACKSREQPTNF